VVPLIFGLVVVPRLLVLLVLREDQLELYFSLEACSMQTSQHFIGLHVNIIHSIAIDFSSSSQSFTGSAPGIFTLLLLDDG